MTNPHSSPLNRIHYFDGQRLDAADLSDTSELEDRLRWLHLSAVHNTWGVASGLEVTAAKSGAMIGIAPGLAYDCYGREIILTEAAAVRVPARLIDKGIDALTLAVFHPETSPDTPDGCFPAADAPFRQIAWRWIEMGRPIRPGVDVPLARVLSDTSIDDSVRHRTDVFEEPAKIMRGRVEKGSQLAQGSYLNWTTTIDTLGAQFIETPLYFATLIDVSFDSLLGMAANVSPDAERQFAELAAKLGAPLIQIVNPMPYQFQLQMWITVPRSFVSGFAGESSDIRDIFWQNTISPITFPLPVSIDWIALQPARWL